MSDIKNIILDFGGVILDLDFSKSHEAFKSLGINTITEELRNVFLELEQGKIEPEVLYSTFRKVAKKDITKSEINNAWCALLRDLPQNRVDFLSLLGKKTPLYLLSNTNKLHIDYLRNREGDKFKQFESAFIKVFYSHEMDSRKPGSEIFEKVIKDLSIKPEETLFVDDMEENILTAKKLGFKTWLFNVDTDDVTKIEKHIFN